MKQIPDNVIFGIPGDREKQYLAKIQNMTLLDYELFTQFVCFYPEMTLSILKILLDKLQLKYNWKPKEHRFFFIKIHEKNVLYFNLYDENKKIEILLDFVDDELESRRAQAYLSILNNDIMERYGINENSSDQEIADLPDAYVIFLMKRDLFESGRPLNHFELCETESDEKVDGLHILYINGNFDGNGKIGDLIKALRDVGSGSINKKIQECIFKLKRNPDSIFAINQMLERRFIKSHFPNEQLRIYRVSNICPYCGEEHLTSYVTLTEEEQRQMDDFYINKKGLSDLAQLIYALDEAPVYVTRRFRCGCCHKSFEQTVAVIKQDEIMQNTEM